MKSIRLNLDALGMCASTLCMIHCLVFPLLLAALPMWKLSAEDSDAVTAPTVAQTSPVADLNQTPVASCADRDCCVQALAKPVVQGDDACTACCSTPADFWIHVGLLAAVAPLGIIAWGARYRHHRRLGVLAVGLFGVLLLSGALLFGHHLSTSHAAAIYATGQLLIPGDPGIPPGQPGHDEVAVERNQKACTADSLR